MDPKFWGYEKAWPADYADNVFLARAYMTIGRAMFPQLWTGKEPLVRPETILPFLPKRQNNDDAYNALLQLEPELVRDWPFETMTYGTNAGMRVRKLLPFELWQKAREAQKHLIDAVYPALFHRRDAVSSQLSDWVQSGILKTRMRAKNGGGFVTYSPELWRGFHFPSALHGCDVTLHYTSHWIFLLLRTL